MNIKQAKNLMEGCGLDFDDGSYCSKEDELCPSCRREINRMKSDAEYFLRFLENVYNYTRERDVLEHLNKEIKKLKKIIEVLDGK